VPSATPWLTTMMALVATCPIRIMLPSDLHAPERWRALSDLRRALLTEVSLHVGEVALGSAHLCFSVSETGLFFLDAFDNP
jgi:hypothetical protein